MELGLMGIAQEKTSVWHVADTQGTFRFVE